MVISHNAEMRFNIQYQKWVAAIHRDPQIMRSSSSFTHTALPEFEEIVRQGEPAVPHIADEMMRPGSEFGLFLGEAVMKIRGWKGSDWGPERERFSLESRNKQIMKRLQDE